MSFKVNSSQQISFNDSVFSLTAREKKALDNSWAKIFADEIFPNIDEERFSVLYSSKASRPNAPVNVIIGALIIKELFDYSDDEIVENLMLDLHLQYALHTTSFEEQPISDKTLSRFRSRCYNYETTHGIDLYHDCVKDLSSKIAKLMNLSGRIKRMDSMMIESNIRFLSRMELIYTCISKLAIYFDKNYPNKIPDDLKHYTDSNDYNRIFYHQLNDNMEQIIQALLSDSDKLLELCGTDYEEVTEYQLFLRCLSDQTVVENGKRRLRTKEDGTMNSTALQNPSDPDATYRNKAGKLHRGYVANLEETVDKNGSVVTDYQYDKNIHTDSQFLQESLSQMDRSEEEIVLITDGGYAGQDNFALAKEKNIKLITTALIGKEAPDALADFTFNDDGTILLRCAAGHEPVRQSYSLIFAGNLQSAATLDAYEMPLKTKNAYRTLPLSVDAIDVLMQQRRKTGNSEWVFPSPTGGPMSPDSVLHMLHRVLKRAGLPKVRFHDLRHTFATMALQNGVDIKTVSGMLGHFSAGFTLDTYAHVTTSAKREAAKTMGNILSRTV